MWFPAAGVPGEWRAARRHLRRVDPVLAKVIARVGRCTLAPRPHREYFTTLCKSIYTQQISTRIATILYGRFAEQFPGNRPSPLKTLRLFDPASPECLAEETIRRVGLSRQKRKYVVDLARRFVDGSVPTRRLHRMTDDGVIEALTCVHGVGRWTAEMFLIFVLNRPDVWPVDDLGLREAVRIAYGKRQRPTAGQLRTFGIRFKPYRTIATWYLWRSLA